MIKKEIREKMLDIFSHYGQEFDAFLIQDDDNFFIVDWKDKNGSGNLATRYILDKKEGTFIITGDSGDCIACWYNELTPENLSVYVSDVRYFMGKIQCSTDKYTYECDDIEADLDEIKEELRKYYNEHPDYYDWDVDDLDEDFEDIKNYLYDFGWAGGQFPEDAYDLMSKFYSEVWESPFSDLGQRISNRIYLWAVGYQSAIEKLRGKKYWREY